MPVFHTPRSPNRFGDMSLAISLDKSMKTQLLEGIVMPFAKQLGSFAVSPC